MSPASSLSNVNLWREHAARLLLVTNIQSGSDFYQDLLLHGINKADIDCLVSSNTSQTQRATPEIISTLLGMGGHISGGSALNMLIRESVGADILEPHPLVKDFDVFFSDMYDYVRAKIATKCYADIDICLYQQLPYELFDLTITECSYSTNGFSTSSKCDDALASGTTGINYHNLIDPVLTLKRILKYNNKYGIRARSEQILFVAAYYDVTDLNLINQVLAVCD